MLSAIKLLENAKNRIALPQHHAIGNVAEDIDGNAVKTLDQSAVCWCALGSVAAEAGIDTRATGRIIYSGQPGYMWVSDETTNPLDDDQQVIIALDALAQTPIALARARFDNSDKIRAREHVFGVNDSHGHKKTLAMFDQAIAGLKNAATQPAWVTTWFKAAA